MINLKGLIIGCGSIGERHLHNLQKLGIKDIAIYDELESKVDALSNKYKVQKFYDLDSALSFRPDFSAVCTFPNSHIAIANECIQNDSHLFIEKPLSSDLKGVEIMLKKAKSRKLNVAVGYNMRFDTGLNLLRKKLQSNEIGNVLSISVEWGHNIKFWRPGSNYKNHYVLKKGGGIILDDSHEYDYVRWLLSDEPKSIFCQTRKIEGIKTQTESLASITLTFQRGTIVNLLIDYVRPRYERSCHIIGEKGDIKWNYIPRQSAWKNYEMKAESNVSVNLFNNKSKSYEKIVKINDMYKKEMSDFIQSILCHRKPLVDGWDGLNSLKIGIAALESAKSNKIINLKNYFV